MTQYNITADSIQRLGITIQRLATACYADSWPRRRFQSSSSIAPASQKPPRLFENCSTAFNADLWPRWRCFGRCGPYPASRNRLYVFVNCSKQGICLHPLRQATAVSESRFLRMLTSKSPRRFFQLCDIRKEARIPALQDSVEMRSVVDLPSTTKLEHQSQVPMLSPNAARSF